MAKSGDGNGGAANSWPGFLSELNKNFLILRDVFGYALSGAVFLAIGVLCKRFSLRDVKYLLDPYQLPAWLAVVVAVGACYAIGHVMTGLAYLPFNIWKNPFRKDSGDRSGSMPLESSPAANLEKIGPTRVPPELIDIRARHPELMIELERQSTMTQLRGSTGVAMLLGSLLFYWFSTPSLGWMLILAGAFLLVGFWFSAVPHVFDLERRTIKAAKLSDEPANAAKPTDTADLKETLQISLLLRPKL